MELFTSCAFLILIVMDPVMGVQDVQKLREVFEKQMSVLQTFDAHYNEVLQDDRLDSFRKADDTAAKEYVVRMLNVYGETTPKYPADEEFKRDFEYVTGDYKAHFYYFRHEAIKITPQEFPILSTMNPPTTSRDKEPANPSTSTGEGHVRLATTSKEPESSTATLPESVNPLSVSEAYAANPPTVYDESAELPAQEDYSHPENFYATAFVTYQAFLATINFRICELYYLTAFVVPMTTKAQPCHKLFLYMHWFTSAQLEKKSRDFGKTAVKRSLGTDSNVEKVAKTMAAINLDFIMDAQFLRCGFREQTQRDTPDDFVSWETIPDYTEPRYGRVFKTLFPENKPIEPIHVDTRSDGKLEKTYTAMYEMVLRCFKDQVLTFEQFFHFTLYGTPLPSELQTKKTLIPDYNFSKKIWAQLPEFMKILLLDITKPRKVYGSESGDAILRSTPVEIIRKLLEIKVMYEVSQLSEEEQETPEAKTFLQDVPALKVKSRCTLIYQRSSNYADYMAVIGPSP